MVFFPERTTEENNATQDGLTAQRNAHNRLALQERQLRLEARRPLDVAVADARAAQAARAEATAERFNADGPRLERGDESEDEGGGKSRRNKSRRNKRKQSRRNRSRRNKRKQSRR